MSIINYSKTGVVYATYRKAGYSNKFYTVYEADIILHKTAKKAVEEFGVSKIPTKKSLDNEYAGVLPEKKTANVPNWKRHTIIVEPTSKMLGG